MGAKRLSRCLFTKSLDDSAAHDKEIEVDFSDVNSMVEFVEYIIEYKALYPYRRTTKSSAPFLLLKGDSFYKKMLFNADLLLFINQ